MDVKTDIYKLFCSDSRILIDLNNCYPYSFNLLNVGRKKYSKIDAKSYEVVNWGSSFPKAPAQSL